jgi:DNA-binding CsgD family transcriptional regulator
MQTSITFDRRTNTIHPGVACGTLSTQACQPRPSTDDPALLGLFNELAYGLIVIDANRQVSHINRAARTALTREQSLRVVGRGLVAWFERDAIPFSSAINKAFKGKRSVLKMGVNQGSIMLLPLQSAAPIAMAVTPASCIQHVALVLERSSCAEALSIAFYAQSHGLTNGEERVLRALSNNQSVVEAARALSSAASTIRTHLNHIREKTGARSLRALVASVKSLPPLMPAFGE